MGLLKGRVAIGTGVGREEGIALAREGGKVVANLDNVPGGQGARDLSRQAINTFGALHILINNAGILRDGMVFSVGVAEWRRVVDGHVPGHSNYDVAKMRIVGLTVAQ